MSAKLKNIYLLLLFCGLIFIYGCTGNKISYVNYRWGLNLPTSYELLYCYENKGFGDGAYYYILNITEESLNINFSETDTEQNDTIIGYFSSLLKEVDSRYRVDVSHELLIYYESKNDGADEIYLIYDNNLSQLTIMEIHI